LSDAHLCQTRFVALNFSSPLSALRSTLRRTVPSPVAASVRRLLGVLSVTRAATVFGVIVVAYFTFVVPRELAVIIGATAAGAVLAGLVPLAVVVAVVRAPI
jgi:hypothetical protein